MIPSTDAQCPCNTNLPSDSHRGMGGARTTGCSARQDPRLISQRHSWVPREAREREAACLREPLRHMSYQPSAISSS